jgi:serine/threonine protein kinase/tetratricopeptide (TPR) repeat protein
MSVAASPEPVQPQTIGPYTIVGTIGHGGMGVVYRAVHAATGEEVALKTVLGTRSEMLAGLRREIWAMRGLRHPGVARIVDDGVDRGVPWYAMELVIGVPLGRRLGSRPSEPRDMREDHTKTMRRPDVDQRRALPDDLPRLLTVMYRLCRALAYIHGKGMVHRDLKPANLIVRSSDQPVLMDFGLVTRFRGAGREVLVVEGLVTGTADYLSPEQAAGEFVDARADLYSVGVMLYEIVTGRLPFDGANANEVIYHHRHSKPLPPSHWIMGVPPVLERLLLRLLEKEPRDRYGYAEDVAQHLVEAGAVADHDDESTAPSAYLYRPSLEGRSPIIDLLGQALLRAKSGNGGLALISGESGIGKTSVASAVARIAARSGFEVIAGECLPIPAGRSAEERVEAGPLHPLRPFLRAVADRCLQHGEAMTDRLLGRRMPVLRDYEPTIAALESARAEESVRLTAEVVQRRLLTDLGETLSALAEEVPLFIIIDDLQWADELTMRFLQSLRPEFFASRRLMILGLYRSDEVTPALHTLLERPDIMRHTLEKLGDDSIAAITTSMLAAADLPAGFLRFLARQSEGNPFFVAEYLLAAVLESILYRDSGRWRVRSADVDDEKLYRALGLPDSLRALVSRRLDMLSTSARGAVEAAAVLGREFDEQALVEILGEGEKTIAALQELIERRVLEQVDSPALLRFAHDKLRETAYEAIAADTRRELHAEAARVIEAAYSNSRELPLHYNELANHWENAGDRVRAIDYYEKAAIFTLRTGAARNAADFLSRLLDLDDRADPVRTAFWYRLLSAAQFGLGDVNASARFAAEGLHRVGVDLPSTRAGWTRAFAANLIEQLLHLMLPRRLFRARQSAWGRYSEAAHAAQRLAESGFYAVDALSMITCSLVSVNLAERCGSVPNVARVYAMLGLITGACGTPKIAARYFDQAKARASESQDIAGQAFALASSAVYRISTAEWEAAQRATLESIRYSELTGDPQDMEIAVTILGHIQFYTGAIAEAKATYIRVRETARKRSNLQHMAWGHMGVARSAIFDGSLDEALEEADNARRAGRNDHMVDVIATAHAAMALLLKGDLAAACDRADRAYALVSESMPTIFEMARGYIAPCEVYLELLWRAREDRLQTAHVYESKVEKFCRELRTLTRRFPMLRPAYKRLAGVAAMRAGNEKEAKRSLQQALDAAVRMRMPVEEALAHLELSKLTSAERQVSRTHSTKAADLFMKTGAIAYLTRTSTPALGFSASVAG